SLATAIALSAPDFTCATRPPPSVIDSMSMWLPTAALIAGAPPWNGTCVAGTLAISLKKYSAAICEPEPTPAEPKLMVLPFAAARTSFSDLAGFDGLIAKASGEEAAMATVVKSDAAKPLFLCSV